MNIVQARCPQCQNTLRIPADWLDRPMRCKHCKNVFTAKVRTPEPAPVGAAATPEVAAPAPTPTNVAPPTPAPAPETAPPQMPQMPPGWPQMPPGMMPMPAGWQMPPGYPGYPPGYYPGYPYPMPGMPPAGGVPGAPMPMPGMPYPGMAPYPMPAPAPMQPAPMQHAPMPHAPAPAPSFGFDESHHDADNMVSKPRARRAKKDNTVLITCVVGGLLLVTAGVLMAILPKILRDPPEKVVLKPQDPKVKANLEFMKKNAGKQGTTPNVGKNPGNSPGNTGGPFTPVASGSGPPRRALFVSPENYLLYNTTLYYREQENAGAFTNSLVRRLSQGAPFDISPTQLFVLTDSDIAGPSGATPQKAVIESAIKDFCESSRAQDRVLLFWSGHACEIDGKGYLIPTEGAHDVKDTCIAIDWVYDQLAKCKARQKVFVFDAFRFPPGRGLELPATGAMTEAVDKQLDAPPPGVQVWTACLKDQQSIEFEGGSLFQLALKQALVDLGQGQIVRPGDPLPIEALVPKVNAIMKDKLSSTGAKGEAMEKNDAAAEEKKDDEKKDDAKKDEKKEEKKEMLKDEPAFVQVSRLSGKEEAKGADPNPAEPAAKAVSFIDPERGGQNNKVVDEILSEIKMFPPMKKSLESQVTSLRASSLPALPKDALGDYKDDGFNPFAAGDGDKLKKALESNREKFPYRVMAADVSSKIKETMDLNMKEFFANPGGPLDAKRKNAFLADQKEPGLAILDLEETLDDMKKLAEDRDKEPSKRWQAHFDLAQARLMSRLVYIYEYNNLIAAIRSDALPELEKFHVGWRVNTSTKVQIKEGKVKDMVKQVGKTWARIEKDYAGTPWAIVAKREKNVSMGLQWVPARD